MQCSIRLVNRKGTPVPQSPAYSAGWKASSAYIAGKRGRILLPRLLA